MTGQVNEFEGLSSESQEDKIIQENTHNREKTTDVFTKIGEVQENKIIRYERPDDLPDELWDGDNETIRVPDLVKAYQTEAKKALDLRKQVSKGMPKAPICADEYKVDFEGFEKKPISDDDKGLKLAKEVAHESGLTQEQFNKFVGGYIRKLSKAGLMNEDFLPKSEEDQRKEYEGFIKEEKDKLGKNADKVIARVNAEANMLFSNGVLNEDDVQVFKEVAFDAAGIQLMDKLFSMNRVTSEIPVATAVGGGIKSKVELESMVADPLYQSDAAYRKKVEAEYERAYDSF